MGRRLGQHFLSDPSILGRIADALEIRPDDRILEIGPGRGSLTRVLAARTEHLAVVELDNVLFQQLKTSDIKSTVKLFQGDALDFDWCETAGGDRFKVVGNVPYYITTPLVEKSLTPPRASLSVFLVQDEVARRMAAAPGSKTYGALSIGVQAAATVERLFQVRPGSFSPPPAVESAVVRIRPLEQPALHDSEVIPFRRFVTAIFTQRRKQLGTILRGLFGMAAADQESLGLDLRRRPETLEVREFVELFRIVGVN